MSTLRSRLTHSSRSVATNLICLLVPSALALLTNPAYAQYMDMDSYAPHGVRLYLGRIGILALSTAAGFGIGAFFSPKFKKFRRLLWLGFAGLASLYTLFGPYPAADTLGYGAATILFFAGIALGLSLGKKLIASIKQPRPTSYGSAQWATYEHLEANGLFERKGFLLGDFVSGSKGASQIHYKGKRHLLTVAPTRSGKGVSSVIPNLLTYPGSVLAIDPKGENALVTAHRRGSGSPEIKIAGMGQEVILLDPWDIAASKLGIKQSCFNPLDFIKANDPDAAENAQILADALVINEITKADGRFWDEEAKALLTGIILYVATATAEEEHRHLGRVRDILTMTDPNLKELLQAMYNHPHPVVSSTAARTAGKDEKLFSSVMASAQSHTHFLDSPRIRESLSRSNFRFEDLKCKSISVYLILPADRLQTFDRWTRLHISQAITVNARNIEDKPEHPVLFLLDEMPALGRLPVLEQAFSLMAGYHMQLWGIVQDLSRLAQVYGQDSYQTFISNSGVIQYFGSRDKMTADYFSSLCGVTTVEVRNFSWAIGRAISFATSFSSGSGGASSSSSNTSSDNWNRTVGVGEAQRQLAYPDELMVLKDHQQIVFVENLDPIPARKVRWHDNAELKQHGVNLHKALPKPTANSMAAQPISKPAMTAVIPDVTSIKTDAGHATETNTSIAAVPAKPPEQTVQPTSPAKGPIVCDSCGKKWTVEVGKKYTCKCKAPLLLAAE
ncbi:MAG: type IV secretory system conjugative DNA transfer family protein [Rhodospirillaceae bacterium]|nr:MAG: type IV secretory system conjugative DNA transfer family protein [Rhodospirillaceae bacterium]